MQDQFAHTVLIGQWTGTDVDVVQTGIVEDQSNVMTRVDQRSTCLLYIKQTLTVLLTTFTIDLTSFRSTDVYFLNYYQKFIA